jgi:hypothetical protein
MKSKLSIKLIVAAAVFLLAQVAGATPAIYIELPTTGVNTGNATTQTNMWYSYTADQFSGDSFNTGSLSQITSLSVWLMTHYTSPTSGIPMKVGDEFSYLALYGTQVNLGAGTANPAMLTNLIETDTFSPGNNTSDSGKISGALDHYQPGNLDFLFTTDNFQTPGQLRPFYKVTFNNLNWGVTPDTAYAFALDSGCQSVGTGTRCADDPYFGAHALLAVKYNYSSSQNAADGQVLLFTMADSGATFAKDSGADLNFEIEGIPEPGTITLVGLGLAGALLLARRRK